MTLNDLRLSPHFKLVEFECPCCHRVMLDSRLITVLENVRVSVEQPVIVTSGYRCPEHNRNIGGAPDSDHLHGWAADVVVQGYLSADLAKLIGFYLHDGRLGTYSDKRCVHVGIHSRIDEGYKDEFHVTPKTNGHGR